MTNIELAQKISQVIGTAQNNDNIKQLCYNIYQSYGGETSFEDFDTIFDVLYGFINENPSQPVTPDEPDEPVDLSPFRIVNVGPNEINFSLHWFRENAVTYNSVDWSENPKYNEFEYSFDGEDWYSMFGVGGVSRTINIEPNETVYFRGKINKDNEYPAGSYINIVIENNSANYEDSDCRIEAHGNIMYLADYDTLSFRNNKQERCTYAFWSLFRDCEALVTAPSLPSKYLEQYCYREMFKGCTRLQTAPSLPSKSLRVGCYMGMFEGCTSLINAPQLPATSLKRSCYSEMFRGCESLINAPLLPAEYINANCYRQMFDGCTSLVTAPELPAQHLLEGCYELMFHNCTSLQNVGDLTANDYNENVIDYYGDYVRAYYGMFNGCSSLTVTPNIALERVTDYNFHSMFKGTNVTSMIDFSNIYLDGTMHTAGKNATFESMYNGCSNLRILTALPSYGGQRLYAAMFKNCQGITNIDDLQIQCIDVSFQSDSSSVCESMFRGCSSITRVNALPYANNLQMRAFAHMFQECSSLESIPHLQSLVVLEGGCDSMFKGCTNLIEAYIDATGFDNQAFNEMFKNCPNFSALHTNISNNHLFDIDDGEYEDQIQYIYTQDWLYNVSSEGTFYKNRSLNTISGPSGVPEGWNIVNN